MIELNRSNMLKSLNQMEINAYKNISIMEAANVNPYAFVYFKNIDLTKVFKAGFNKNAKYVFFTQNDIKYLKFSVSINLNNRLDDFDRRRKRVPNPKYFTLKERGEMNRNTLEVYSDGVKVPDEKVLITIISGSTDVYIPVKYIERTNKTTHDITLMINQFSNNYPYFNFYSVYNNENNFSVPFLDETEYTEINKSKIRFYKNGYLQNNYTLSNSGKFNVKELNLLEGDEIEIIYREDTIHYEHRMTTDKVVVFPRDLLERKTIPIDIFEGYIDGVRQFPLDMKQVTPRHISLNNTEFSEITSYICYNGNSIENNNHYIDDLTQFFNFHYEDASEIFNGTYDSYLPDYIENIQFPPEVIKIMEADKPTTEESMDAFLKDKLKEYIKMNPENFKYYLDNEVSKGRDYTFTYEDILKYVRTNTKKELGDFNYMEFESEMIMFQVYNIEESIDTLAVILIDGYLIPNTAVINISYRNKLYLYVDKTLFDDCKQIRILTFPVFNSLYYCKEFKEQEVTLNEDEYGYLQNIDDILIMKKDNDGWVKEWEVEKVLNDDNSLTITLNNFKEGESYIVYNSSLTYNKIKYITEDDIVPDQPTKVLFDRVDDEDKVYPVMSYYTPLVFLNDKFLAEGLEYEIISQYNYDTRNMAEIFFKRRLDVGDKVEIIYTEGYYENLGYTDFVNNQYGIIFFDKLKIPFSSYYLDLYVNGIRILPEDIENISTNIIRVKNVDDIFEVQLRSKLSIPLRVLNEFSKVFIDNPSLWHEYIKKYWMRFGKINRFYEKLNPEAKYEFDENYSYFWEDEDNENIYNDLYWKEPEETIPNKLFWNEGIGTEDIINPYLPERIDLIANEVAYQMRQGLLSKLIDCNEYIDYSNNKAISELLTDEEDYIEIDCNRECIATAYNINCNDDVRTDYFMEKVLNDYSDMIEINEDETYSINIPDDDPLWEEIYKEELQRYIVAKIERERY